MFLHMDLLASGLKIWYTKVLISLCVPLVEYAINKALSFLQLPYYAKDDETA